MAQDNSFVELNHRVYWREDFVHEIVLEAKLMDDNFFVGLSYQTQLSEDEVLEFENIETSQLN